MNPQELKKWCAARNTARKLLNAGVAKRTAGGEIKRIANKLIRNFPPYYENAHGYTTLYRGMCPDEARLIRSGQWDEVGIYYTPSREVATRYAGYRGAVRGYVMEIYCPVACIKDATEGLDGVWVCTGEALPQSSVRFYRVLFGRVLIPCRPRRNQ